MATGTLSDTYAAAVQHDVADVPEHATLVGVVRRPTAWFHPLVEENHPELGPPDALLEEFQAHRDDLAARGVCEREAHNATWEAVDFADRYRSYLESDPEAGAAVDGLLGRLGAGEDLALVCYENTDTKRCHRTVLRERIESRL